MKTDTSDVNAPTRFRGYLPPRFCSKIKNLSNKPTRTRKKLEVNVLKDPDSLVMNGVQAKDKAF